MNYTLTNNHVSNATISSSVYSAADKKSLITKIMAWFEAQESNRFLWLALAFFLQIGMIVPLTAYSIIFFGENNMALWIILVIVNVPTLILNLAAMPTKITLPFLFFAWLTELSIILFCVVLAMLA